MEDFQRTTQEFQRTAELPLFPQIPKFGARVQRHEEGRRANSEDKKGFARLKTVCETASKMRKDFRNYDDEMAPNICKDYRNSDNEKAVRS